MPLLFCKGIFLTFGIDILFKLMYNINVANKHRGIAQLVEQRSPKPRAVSSSLTTPAIQSGSNTAFEPLFIF